MKRKRKVRRILAFVLVFMLLFTNAFTSITAGSADLFSDGEVVSMVPAETFGDGIAMDAADGMFGTGEPIGTDTFVQPEEVSSVYTLDGEVTYTNIAGEVMAIPNIRVYVVDAATNILIKEMLTDEAGKFQVENVGAGTYFVDFVDESEPFNPSEYTLKEASEESGYVVKAAEEGKNYFARIENVVISENKLVRLELVKNEEVAEEVPVDPTQAPVEETPTEEAETEEEAEAPTEEAETEGEAEAPTEETETEGEAEAATEETETEEEAEAPTEETETEEEAEEPTEETETEEEAEEPTEETETEEEAEAPTEETETEEEAEEPTEETETEVETEAPTEETEEEQESTQKLVATVIEVIKERVNVRTAYDVNDDTNIALVAEAGTKFEVTAAIEAEDGIWYQIKSEDQELYIRSDMVQVVEQAPEVEEEAEEQTTESTDEIAEAEETEEENTDETAEAEGTEENTDETAEAEESTDEIAEVEETEESTDETDESVKIAVNVESAILRTAPSTESEENIYTTVEMDAEFEVLETLEVTENEETFIWYKISYKEAEEIEAVELYIRSDVVRIVEEAEVPEGETVGEETETPEETVESTDETEDAEESVEAETTKTILVVKALETEMILRSSMEEADESNILAVAGTDVEYEVLETITMEDGSIWYKVSYAAEGTEPVEAYINGVQVEAVEKTIVLEEAVEDAEETLEDDETDITEAESEEEAEVLWIRIIGDDVNLRAEASTEADVLELLSLGMELEVIETVTAEDGSIWYKVKYGELEGFVIAEMAEIMENTEETEEPVVEDVVPLPSLEYEDEKVKITVCALVEGAIPEGSVLSVIPIEKENAETSAQYAEVEQKLQEKAENEEYDITGFLAYDISFIDAEGNKIEPNGQVAVSIDYKKAAVPEEVKEKLALEENIAHEDAGAVMETYTETTEAAGVSEVVEVAEATGVTIMHLEENENGEVANVVDMVQEEQVTALTVTENQEVEKTEFVTESFSVFTITWLKGNKNENSGVSITIYTTAKNYKGEYVTLYSDIGSSLFIKEKLDLSTIDQNQDLYQIKGSFDKTDYKDYVFKAAYVVNNTPPYDLTGKNPIATIKLKDKKTLYSYGEGTDKDLKDGEVIIFVYEPIIAVNCYLSEEYSNTATPMAAGQAVNISSVTETTNLTTLAKTITGNRFYQVSLLEIGENGSITEVDEVRRLKFDAGKLYYSLWDDGDDWEEVTADKLGFMYTENKYANCYARSYNVANGSISDTPIPNISIDLSTVTADTELKSLANGVVNQNDYSFSKVVLVSSEGKETEVQRLKYIGKNLYYVDMDDSDDWQLVGSGDQIRYIYVGKNASIPTEDTREIIDIALYDYSENATINGLVFHNDDKNNLANFNKWIGFWGNNQYRTDNNFAVQGIVDTRWYNSNGQPVSAQEFIDSSGAGYPKVIAGGKNDLADTLLSNPRASGLNHLFVKNGNYYEYNSATNYAYYPGNGKDFIVYNGTREVGNDKKGDFMPWDDINSNTKDFYFGMTVGFNFIQPEGGKVDGENMVFEFSGDDDVWVFIDGKLVLDIGGIHGAVGGTINFATGEVKVDRVVDKSYTPGLNGYGTSTTLKDIFQLSGITFDDYSEHRLEFIYLERGAGESNCHLKFNIPPIPKESLQVRKEITNTDKEKYSNVEFTFRVYLQNSGTDSTELENYHLMPEGTEYEIWEDRKPTGKTGTVSKNGTFILKHGQTASFNNIDRNLFYYAEEIGVSSDEFDKVEINGWNVSYFDEYNNSVGSTDGTVSGNSSYLARSEIKRVGGNSLIAFKNNCAASNKRELWITKKISTGQPVDSTDTFSFKISLEDTDGRLTPYKGSYYIVDENAAVSDQTYTGTTSNGVVSGIKVNQSVVLTQILSGTDFKVEEVWPEETQSIQRKYKEYDDNNDKQVISNDSENIGVDHSGIEGSDGAIALGKNAKVVITNTPIGSLEITKVWSDNNEKDHSADVVYAGLYEWNAAEAIYKPLPGKVKVISQASNWKAHFEGLGKNGNYTVKELIPVNEDASHDFEIINGEDKLYYAPVEKITVSGAVYRPTYSEMSPGTKDNGYSYSITITNERLMDIAVEKVWSDGAEQHQEDAVYVGLYKYYESYSGASYVPVSDKHLVLSNNTENASMSWKGAFNGLEVPTETDEYVYVVRELRECEDGETSEFTIDSKTYAAVTDEYVLQDGSRYVVEYEDLTPNATYGKSFKIINNLIKKINVKKVWGDETKETEVYVGLYEVNATDNTAAAVGTPIVLNDNNKWQGTFDRLDAAKTYVVKELTVSSTDEGDFEIDGVKYVAVERIYKVNGNEYQVTYGNPVPVDGQANCTEVTITNKLILGSIQINKINPDNVPLDGAEFKIYRVNGTEKEDLKRTVTTANGKAIFDNLPAGTYEIEEIKAPLGYTLPATTFTVKVGSTEAKINAMVNVDKAENAQAVLAENLVDGEQVELYYDLELTVTNYMVYDLPSTGSTGIFVYLISGVLLMMAAAWIIYKNKCREVLRG